MNKYILTNYNTNTDNKFIIEFNKIFNKIPHIYSEIFLTLFSERFKYFIIFDSNSISLNFTKILQRMLSNINQNYNQKFFYHYLKEDLNILLENTEEKYLNNQAIFISKILSTNIENQILLDIIDNNIFKNNYYQFSNITPFSNHDKLCLYQITEIYLISKVLIKVIKLLNFYNSKKNTSFYKLIKNTVNKYRTWELTLDNVLDAYDYKYKNIITKSDFKILIYLICLSKNGKEIENNINYHIDKIFTSLGYNTDLTKIIDYKRGYDYLEVLEEKHDNYLVNLFYYRDYPYIYKNISECLEILFQNYYDDYNFLTNKDKILKKIFYLYMKNIDLHNKLVACNTYKMWEYEWDTLKNKYELNY